MSKTYCVYAHISPVDRIYIGVTCQKPNRRWRNGNGYKSNSLFYNAINKYGWDNFSHLILVNNLSVEEAKKLEIELIALYDTTNKVYGYNLTVGGDGVTGFKHTEEHKAMLSSKMSGECNHMYGVSLEGKKGADNPMYGKRGSLNPNSRSIECVTTGEIFGSVKEGADKYSTYRSDINKCAKGIRSCAGKLNGVPLVWRYPDES